MLCLSCMTSLTRSILVQNTPWKIASLWVPRFPHYSWHTGFKSRPSFHSPEKTIHPDCRCSSQSNPQPLQKGTAPAFPQSHAMSVSYLTLPRLWVWGLSEVISDPSQWTPTEQRVVPIWSVYHLAQIAFNGRIIVSPMWWKRRMSYFHLPTRGLKA